MQHLIKHPDFTKKKLSLESATTFSASKIFLDDRPIPRIKRKFDLIDDNNKSRILKFKLRFLDPIPNVLIDGELVNISPPLSWYQYLWICLPVIMALQGGALGGVIGLSAAYASSQIFRSERTNTYKYSITGLISVFSVGIFFISSTYLRILINQIFHK